MDFVDFVDPGRISRKTRVPGLSCGVVCVILRLAVLVENRLVTDGQTDGQTQGHGYYRGCIASRGNNSVWLYSPDCLRDETSHHTGLACRRSPSTNSSWCSNESITRTPSHLWSTSSARLQVRLKTCPFLFCGFCIRNIKTIECHLT